MTEYHLTVSRDTTLVAELLNYRDHEGQFLVNIARDLPNVFKDRLVRGCVKLATIAEGDYSYLRKSRCNWFNAMLTVCTSSPLGKQLCDIVDKDLYRSADATHFRELHGSGMHDLSQTLVAKSSQIASSANGLTMQIIIEAFDLELLGPGGLAPHHGLSDSASIKAAAQARGACPGVVVNLMHRNHMLDYKWCNDLLADMDIPFVG